MHKYRSEKLSFEKLIVESWEALRVSQYGTDKKDGMKRA